MATVPTPATQVAGLVVAAATINGQGNLATYLAGRVESGGARRPLCVMRQTVAQSLTTATDAAVTFDTEDVDYDNGHSTVTNTSRYTAGTAGWYHIDAIGAISPNVTGLRRAYLRLNGTTVVPASNVTVQTVTQASVGTALALSRLVFLNATDYIELMLRQDSGGALNTDVTAQFASSMCVEWRSV